MAIQVTGIGIAIDREQTTAVYDAGGNVIADRKGKNAIHDFVSVSGVPVYTVAGIKEVVNYLYLKKVPVMFHGTKTPIDEQTKAQFDDYLDTYGIE
jgi:orotate phosphoribosyltransferase